MVDFASGFYAIEVEEESQPYLCIYTEGIGYHAYARMPMGIADAPLWFCDMTGRALHDLTTTIQLETFVDDNALAGNDFTNVLQRLRVFFERCREQDLSVSPQKTRLFMQDIVFGGSRVGKDGIRPDIAKLEAVANWPMPQNLLDLMRFLGLTGYFRSLIQDYSRIAAPLTDLQRNLDISCYSSFTSSWCLSLFFLTPYSPALWHVFLRLDTHSDSFEFTELFFC